MNPGNRGQVYQFFSLGVLHYQQQSVCDHWQWDKNTVCVCVSMCVPMCPMTCNCQSLRMTFTHHNHPLLLVNPTGNRYRYNFNQDIPNVSACSQVNPQTLLVECDVSPTQLTGSACSPSCGPKMVSMKSL